MVPVLSLTFSVRAWFDTEGECPLLAIIWWHELEVLIALFSRSRQLITSCGGNEKTILTVLM